ncbi:hypothetical protein [Knoellia subterranea]|uniref:Uncharacterized protein n=1 Tax=Knoellia subterranea KCTC 19937 TaxID=1385521 RepID=A0A0A0JHQ8_9MICO|nr:hypothetical protein [Knoellia subterranea]KGN36284.1 hypothetical protein N803_05025 [Knoellia subterranea KCTC 19937]
MSDHFTNPQGGEDPIADRLRAFGAGASRTTVLPPIEEIHRGGDRRRRTQRVAVGAATLAVGALIGGAVFASQLGQRGDETLLPGTHTPTPTATSPEVTPTVTSSTSPTVTTTPTASATTTGGSTPSSTPSGTPSRGSSPSTPSSNGSPAPHEGTETAVIPESTYVVVPAAWKSSARDTNLEYMGHPEATVHRLCLTDTSPNPADFACDLQIDVGSVLPGAEGNKVWQPGQVAGWSDRSGVTLCPGASASDENYVDTRAVPSKSFTPIGVKTAEKYTYRLTCTSGTKFTVVQYWLPNSHIRVTDYTASSRVDDILGSFFYLGS